MRLEEIADQITHANRQKMARLTAERIALRRNPDALPNLRAGRGGGGWAIADKHLLSAGEQALEKLTAKSDSDELLPEVSSLSVRLIYNPIF